MSTTARTRAVTALMCLPLTVTLVACGSGSSSKSSANDSTAGSSTTSDTGSAPAPVRADPAIGAEKVANTEAVITRAVISTGTLRLTGRHLEETRQDAIDVATGLGGQVADEQSRSDGNGVLDRVDLTLRVPAASFEKALDDLSALGTVRNRQQSAEDVTTQVIDNDARVKAQAASVASIQRLLARARTIGEIMSVESQLSSRQAELDSLRQQQKWLADQTSMSTVQLTVERHSRSTSTAPAGFLGGLGHGWHALGASTVAVGTAVGAVLPFAVLALLVGLPVRLLLRRRRAPAVPPAPAGT